MHLIGLLCVSFQCREGTLYLDIVLMEACRDRNLTQWHIQSEVRTFVVLFLICRLIITTVHGPIQFWIALFLIISNILKFH